MANNSTMKTTVEKLRSIRSIVSQLKNVRSRFGYACLRSDELINSCLKKHDRLFEEKKYDLASVDDKGNLIYDEKRELKYTKENHKKLLEFAEVQGKEAVEYEPYICKDISSVEDSLDLLNKLNGFVVKLDIEKLYNK